MSTLLPNSRSRVTLPLTAILCAEGVCVELAGATVGKIVFCCETEVESELAMDVDAISLDETRAEVCFFVHLPGLVVEHGGEAALELELRGEVLAGAVWEGTGAEVVAPFLPK